MKMYVFIVFDRQNKKAKDVFLTKILAENYIKNQYAPNRFYIIEKFIY